MKNIFKNKVLGAVLAAVVMIWPCAAGDKAPAGVEKTKVPAEVTEIYIEAGNMVSITFVKTADAIAATEVRSKSKAEAPVSIEQQGTKMIVKVAGSEDTSKPKSGAMITILKLHMPAGRNVTVLGRNLVVSGDIAAKNLAVKAVSVSMHALKLSASEDVSVDSGFGDFKFTLSAAKKLIVNVKNLSGKITVPASTEVVCPDKSALQIARTGKAAAK
ncbi:MAG: hypothetical protein A2270_03830 [Elusimicrobia bacterium RIFOXYA12_FULL_51_18]|nr:MAG: hypothetical protein A2270_03830 [Elusimicrobia bacterium RIFOXYA12_FULL_51_18]OGS29881.1 MAG: hypothetical protein A2218_02530 [Elusimicrobia bacterium RIFOXYA2_FULL_53_38]